ncbi:MAG: Cof-type HAD-IIB family hydrolase [Cetobacterium sp.]|uniref:Cof-type HAD-IIB family hydrolase n=1 Tax=Cetobacterium sp. TaxID=2071632 RepID=UPI003F369D88
MKSIALDLDGTLLNSEKDISHENISILRLLYSKEIKIFIVTGRMYTATQKIIKKIGIPITAICYNGAKVIHSENDSITFEQPLSEEIVKVLIEISQENKSHLNLYQNEEWFVENENDWQTKYYEKNIGFKAIQKKFNNLASYVMTKALFVDERINLLEIEKKIKNKLGEKVYLTYSQEKYLEVLNCDVNKGKTLERILKENKLDLESCVAFGDANNDKEMLIMVGCGVAMGNAEEELKNIANYITDTNDNNGVCKFLEQKI